MSFRELLEMDGARDEFAVEEAGMLESLLSFERDSSGVPMEDPVSSKSEESISSLLPLFSLGLFLAGGVAVLESSSDSVRITYGFSHCRLRNGEKMARNGSEVVMRNTAKTYTANRRYTRMCTGTEVTAGRFMATQAWFRQ